MSGSPATRQVEALLRWLGSPGASRAIGSQARRIRASLLAADARRQASGLAEALIARRAVRTGLPIAFEVPTPSGRTCDVVVRDVDVRICLHVKHLAATPASAAPRAHARMPAAFRDLAREPARRVMGIEWVPGLRPADLRHAAGDARQLLLRGSVGDESILHGRAGQRIGRARVIAPTDMGHAVIVAGIPDRGMLDSADRLLRKAHAQFMPRGHNVIVVAGRAHDAHAVRDALAGAPIERWDRFPRRGERMAHGRATDGFWSGQSHRDSALAAWISLDGSPRFRCWVRDGHEPPPRVRATCERIFGAGLETLR